jgi:hypothetical protein
LWAEKKSSFKKQQKPFQSGEAKPHDMLSPFFELDDILAEKKSYRKGCKAYRPKKYDVSESKSKQVFKIIIR